MIATGIHQGHGADRVDALMAQVAMRCMGRPNEIANLVADLFSPAASYVTGAIVEEGGGL